MDSANQLVGSLILAAAAFLAFMFGGLGLVGVLIGIFLLVQLIDAVRQVEDRVQETNERLAELTRSLSG